MDIQIRKATFNDLQQILNIENSLEHKILSNDILSSTLTKDSYYYFVVTDNDNIVGYFSAELLVDHFDILAIAVLPKYRKQGIASKLLNVFLDICILKNINEIFLEVRCNNCIAINFYEKHGFKKISVRPNYYSDTKEDAYVYKRVV